MQALFENPGSHGSGVEMKEQVDHSAGRRLMSAIGASPSEAEGEAQAHVIEGGPAENQTGPLGMLHACSPGVEMVH